MKALLAGLFHKVFTNAPLGSIRWLMAIPLTAILTIGLIFTVSRRLQEQSRKDIQKELATVLATTRGALHLWKKDLQSDLEAVSELPSLKKIVTREMLNPSAEEENRKDLVNVLRPWIKAHSYLHFRIYVKENGITKPLFKHEENEKSEFTQSLQQIEYAFKGNFRLDEPRVWSSPDEKVVIIAAVPIRNSSGRITSVLAFSIDVFTTFTAITELGRLGDSGETYAVNRSGQMVTSSRFNPEASRKRTRLKLKNIGSGFDLEGYKDYRGIPVVGAWLWDQHLNLGLVTEIDKSEAFRSYEMIQQLTWFMVAIIIIGMIVILLFREARSRNMWKIETLQQMNSARKDLLSVVSHDLKNPLSSLLMTNELLLKTLPQDEAFTAKRKKLLERNLHAAEQMRRLITDLLDSAKIEAGKLEIHPIECSAREILDHALEVLEPIAEQKSVEIKLNLDPVLPSLSADPERILQVFSNLLGNAVKFTEAGGLITITGTTQKEFVLFSVSDTGAGISAEDVPHLFERYWQAKKAKSFGTGLGLAICKELVTAHGGKIWVESEPGRGTTFYFTIPDRAHGQI